MAKQKITAFLSLTFIICLPFYILMSRDSVEFYLASVIMIMWAPGLAAIILHASHNLFIQSVFDGLTKDTGITKYFTTDFGVGLALFYGVAAVLFWNLKRTPEQKDAPAFQDLGI